jgi:hypothetical protein
MPWEWRQQNCACNVTARFLFAGSETASLEQRRNARLRCAQEKSRQVRLQVSLTEALIEAIDDYRFAIRAPNRSEAARQLLKVGLAARPPEEQSD